VSDQVQVGSVWQDPALNSLRTVKVIERDARSGQAIVINMKTGVRTRMLMATLVKKWKSVFAIEFDARYTCPTCGTAAEPFGKEPVIWSPDHGAFFHVHKSRLRLETMEAGR